MYLPWKILVKDSCFIFYAKRNYFSTKKQYKWNWPELDLYCGYFKLTTGIYIRTAITLIITVITIASNSFILKQIIEFRPIMLGTNKTTMEDYLAEKKSKLKPDLSKLHMIYSTILAYYILWLTYKVMYVSILFWTLFAIFKRSGKMLKLFLYISIPNLILDIFISFLAALIVRLNIKILFVFCILSEGYNILAINSEYKRITGKAKVRHKDIESGNGTPSPFINPSIRESGENEVHCRGCNCTSNELLNEQNGVVSIQPSPDPIQTTLLENKEIDDNDLHYAITGIRNPIHNEEVVRNEIAGSANSQHTVRPNTLDPSFNLKKDEKFVITDEPVIYDVNQLNVGTSPVIEDRQRES